MRWLLLLLATGPARAEEYNPPGLEADSQAYRRALTQLNPAGLPPPQQRQAEQRAAQAAARNDWAAVAPALEARLSAGNGGPDLWLLLAQAQLKRTPPDAKHAAEAAWLAYGRADTGLPQIAPLLVLADALARLDRPVQALGALDAVIERTPDGPRYQRMRTDLRQAAGLLISRVRTEPESDPALACVEFTSPPAAPTSSRPTGSACSPPSPTRPSRARATPTASPGLSSAPRRRSLCWPGSPARTASPCGARPPCRSRCPTAPRLVFNQRLFLLPRNQAPRLSLASINLSAVKLKVLRVGERNVVPWTRDTALGQSVERYAFDNQADNGKIVWEGAAAIPKWQPNLLAHTVLPLPDVFDAAGIYLLLATPGDGTPDTGAASVQVVVRTDLAPTVWRGSDGLTVQLRSIATAAPLPGVAISLLARNNDVLAEAASGPDGVVRFPAPLLAGTGPQAPQSLHGQIGDDLVALDLTTAAFDLSDRGVEGLPDPGPLDAFVWTDRGIYRPGETVRLMALLRDAAGQPVDLPPHLVIKRPNGQVFLDRVPERGADSSVYLPIALPLSAPAGLWSVDILADPKRPPIGHAAFKVDAFVPDRMAVEAAPSGPIVPGQPYALPVTARFLYGAPAIDLAGSATLRLTRDTAPPPALAGYRVGLDAEEFAPGTVEITLPSTDKQGLPPCRSCSNPPPTAPSRSAPRSTSASTTPPAAPATRR